MTEPTTTKVTAASLDGRNNQMDELERELDAWDPMGEDYRSPRNTLALNPQDTLSVLIGKALPIDAKLGKTTLCEHFAKHGTCADGFYCTHKHVTPSQRERIWNLQNVYDLNRAATCLNYTYLTTQSIKPDPDKLLLVSVTNASRPNNFYLIAPYDTVDFSNLTEKEMDFYVSNVTKNSSIKTKLYKVSNQLASLLDKPYRLDNMNETVYLSQVVACKLKDGSFRRAMVTGLPDDAMDDFNYKLLLLDVGCEIELPRELIYDIRASCFSEPPMALNCRLNLKPANGQTTWSEEIPRSFLEKARRDQYLLCKIINFIEYDRIYTVELLHLKSRKSLTEVLLRSGQVELLD